MKIIEVNPLENGGHRNQIAHNFKEIPEGWAMIPDDMEIPETFPFVNIVAENRIVIKLTAGVVPQHEPESEPEPSAKELLNALTGVMSHD